MSNYEYLLSDINTVKGIGPKITKLFKKKNINTIFDLLWSLPIESIDRSKVTKINELQLGKIQTVNIYLISKQLYMNFIHHILIKDLHFHVVLRYEKIF